MDQRRIKYFDLLRVILKLSIFIRGSSCEANDIGKESFGRKRRGPFTILLEFCALRRYNTRFLVPWTDSNGPPPFLDWAWPVSGLWVESSYPAVTPLGLAA